MGAGQVPVLYRTVKCGVWGPPSFPRASLPATMLLMRTQVVDGRRRKVGAESMVVDDADRASHPKVKRQRKVSMSVEDVERVAAEEGLTLVPSRTASSGYWRVQAQGSHSNTFKATGQKEVVLGNFPSAAEAALAVARHLGPTGSKEVVPFHARLEPTAGLRSPRLA